LFRTARLDSRERLRSLLDRLRAGSGSRPSAFVRLELEQLESRALLSANVIAIDPAATGAPGTAQPNSTAVPLSTYGNLTYYTPAEIRQAYGINQAFLPNGQLAGGEGETIAIIVAGDDPNIGNDLAVFDRTFGLPDPPSFLKAVQGSPSGSAAWAQETALDVEWAHAIAPYANILLVEAQSDTYSDLLACANWAAANPGVVAVSMSFGGQEFAGENSYDQYFTVSPSHIGGGGLYGGVTFVASAGDSGAWYGAEYPSVSPYVLSVGGTSLHLGAGSSYAGESAWTYGGGGYSHYEAEATYQWAAQQSYWRTNPDVSYNADPNTGFLVYNSYSLPAGDSGWWIVGGTSAGAPQWAGILALADQARNSIGLGSLGNAQADIYQLSSADFHQSTSGSNGYSATAAYNMATGRGTPIVNQIVHDLLWAPTYALVNLTWTPSVSSTTATAVNHADAGPTLISGAGSGSEGPTGSQGDAGQGGSLAGLLPGQQIATLLGEAQQAGSATFQGGSSASGLSDTFWQHLGAEQWSELEQSLVSASLLQQDADSHSLAGMAGHSLSHGSLADLLLATDGSGAASSSSDPFALDRGGI
jgi:hypothetical protein